MDLEDLLESVGGDQVRRVMSIVGQVDDNWDDLMGAVAFIRDHGEGLVDLLRRLPEILDRAGEALGTAADAAVQASGFLNAGDGVDADDIASVAGAAMDVCQRHLGSVAQLLERVGDELAGISVPTFDVERSELMGLSVVSGIDIGSSPVASGAARNVRASANQLNEVASALADAGDGLERLQGNLSSAGERISMLAGEVEQSGYALSELAGGAGAKKRTPAARRKPANKQTSPKKAAAKNPATKRKPATRKKASSKRATTAKKATPKKPAPKRTAAKKAAPKRTAAKKAASKKATTKKPAPKKAAPKKAGAPRRKPAARPKLGGGVLKPRT